ncbi:Hypothetical protein, putative [Bodo saltans]|uniref:Uncharacterized protein n=1 Tax=Bodo saltans TaxID=75058 RepID=A0A0S4KIK1_BODSA|nr:Hypothetical protein, putative [Bodo saltans]|eukprot:CUI14972.1 Hypothetical protein, putative [Bodo saltans]
MGQGCSSASPDTVSDEVACESVAEAPLRVQRPNPLSGAEAVAVSPNANVHATLHNLAIRDEFRLRAQQKVVADRLERSRQHHILPPCSNNRVRTPRHLTHSSQASSLETSHMTISASTPRNTSSLNYSQSSFCVSAN